jgi:CRP/FNR family transcriptional regulator
MAGQKNLATVLHSSQFCDIDKEVGIVSTKDLMALPIFYRLDEAEREIIASITRKGNYLKDEIIFNQSQSGGQLFVLYKGEVKITRLIRARRNQTLAQLKSGDIFGEETLICGDEHTTSAVCTTDSEIFVIKKDDFDRIAREHPVLGTKILNFVTRSVCSRLRKINAKICDMVDYVTAPQSE